jgi:hypothetical protein
MFDVFEDGDHEFSRNLLFYLFALSIKYVNFDGKDLEQHGATMASTLGLSATCGISQEQNLAPEGKMVIDHGIWSYVSDKSILLI